MGSSSSDRFSEMETLDQDLLAEFEATGYKDAGKLRGASRTKSGKRHKDTGYESDVSYTEWAPAGSSLFQGNVENLSGIVAAFEDFRVKQRKTKKEHEEYVKLTQENPGRSATILTPMSGPESKTVLGASIQGGSSVLG